VGLEGFGVTSAFWGLGVLAVGAALGIMLARSLLHAVLWLILAFIALAGLFVTLSADFVAVAQVLVYAGAVGVLVIFAIMLTPNSATGNAETRFFGAGLLAASVLSGVMVYVAAETDWHTIASDRFAPGSTATQIGEALVNRYVLPFEVASVLLIAAMVGALVLVRNEQRDEQEPQRREEREEEREVVEVR
jgi:NADH:ubiquinone oxidoreductase subunit 6 (subunit J)